MEEIMKSQEKYIKRSSFFFGCFIGLTVGLLVFWLLTYLIVTGSLSFKF
ncbi:hypothetical protein FLJU110815_20285 [Flavobacterium jumunjinense]